MIASPLLFWILVALMIGVASLLVLWPLARKRLDSEQGSTAFQQDIAVFKDQLAEIDRDLKRGVVNEADADAARAEVSRRLLDVSAKAEAVGEGNAPSISGMALLARRLTAISALLLVPVIAASFYVLLGNPDKPDQPLQARLENRQLALTNSDLPSLIAQVETHLASNPDDAQGWEVIGPVYRRLGRNDDAVRAFENIVRLKGRDAVTLSDLGEALVLRESGIITARAQTLFEEVLASNPNAIRPRFFLAMGLNQEGRFAEAVAAWRDLLGDATPQSAWVAPATDQLNMALRELGQAPIRNEDMAANIATMSPDERQQMISGMVEGLAARLAEEPDNLPDWLRLIRSYMVLEQPGAAAGALQDARTYFAGDNAAMTALNDLAIDLNLGSENGVN